MVDNGRLKMTEYIDAAILLLLMAWVVMDRCNFYWR